MLYSYNVEDAKAFVFSMFIESLINGNSSYKDEVVKVLSDVKALSQGAKSLFSIDRNYFTIIVHLSKDNPEYFKKIDLNNIDSKDYAIIESSLRKHNSFVNSL